MTETADETKLHFLDYWRVIRVRLPLIILTFLVVMITVGIVTYFAPRLYEAKATLEIRERDMDMAVFKANNASLDPRFTSTQFQIIQKKEILYPVIDTLNLFQKWGPEFKLRNKEDAYYKLKGMLSMRELRGTDLIEVSVLDTDPAEAADLANTIAKEYQKSRISEQSNYSSKSLSQLAEQIEIQKKKVDALRAEANRLRQENNIVDFNPDTIADPLQASGSVLMTIEQQVSGERLKVETLKAKLDMIGKLSDDEIIQSLPTLEIQDSTISTILPEYHAASAEEARLLNGGLGPNHPNVKSLRAKIQKYQEQLKDQVGSLRKTLKTNLEIADSSLKKLETKLEEARQDQQKSKTEGASYAQAKNDYIQAQKLLEVAQTRISTENIDIIMPRNPIKIWEYAEPPLSPSRPRVFLYLLMGAVVGAVMGIGLAFFIEYLDTSVKTMEDVETFLGVPVLAIIPKNIALLINESPDHPDAEAYRILRTNVEFNRKSPDANTLTVISGGAGEGKSTTLNNLAYTFARGGYNTLVVDADLRRPTQHRLFNLSNDVGLTNYLTTDMPLEEVILPSSIENLYFLPSGKLPLDAVGILNSQRMVEMISELKSRFDMVFFDSPPILGVSDASVLVSAVDLAIIVVQHRRFPRAMLQRVKQSILNVGGTILGVVLNNVDIRHDHHYEYYTSYYNYYQPGRKQETAKPSKAAGPIKKPRIEGGEY
ncbi:MAG: polysaccharide biosynthesis tyrosine autokinase [Chthoniobacterales bacterium]